MKKRVLMIILSIALFFVGANCFSKANAEEGQVVTGTCGINVDNLTWEFNSATGNLTISGEGEMQNMPSWTGIDITQVTTVTMNEGVTNISMFAFREFSEMNNVQIPKSVISIGDRAFENCGKLISVSLSENVRQIGYGVFWNCDNLTGIWVDENNFYLSSDDNGVLFDKKKEMFKYVPKKISGTYVIPETVTYIEAGTFSGCNDLTGIIIHKNVTQIANGAFAKCAGLTEIKVDENNVYYSSDTNGALFNVDKTQLLCVPVGSASAEYVVSKGVTSIGASAFSGCEKLITLQISDSVSYMETGVFSGCNNLAEICVDENNADYSSDAKGVLFNKDKTQLLYVPPAIMEKGYVIPEGVISIGTSAFSGCRNLISVVIPASVTSIEKGAFSDCNNLAEIRVEENNAVYSSDEKGVLFNKDKTEFVHIPLAISGEYVIPEGITVIKTGTFSGHTKLTDVVLPEGVTTIEMWAFNGCSITNIQIPESVTSLAGGAFEGCENLIGIWVDENNENYSSDDKGVLFNKDKTELIVAPWAISGKYEIPSSVSAIGERAFEYCRNLIDVIIPESVTSIGMYAFMYCENLTSVVIPEGVTVIPYYAFMNCSNLINVVLPNSLTEIWADAFSACTSLNDIVIPNGVTLISAGSFSSSGLNSVTIPASVTVIGRAAFGYCSNLKEIKFEGDAPTINAKAFGETYPTVATVYYPAMSETWNAETMLNYGGDLTWVPYYDVLEDSDLTWINLEGGDLSISVHAPYSEFAGVQIDENSLTADYFTVSESENGTVVIISEEYLMSLEGKGNSHSIVISFVKGDASADLDIVFEEEPTTEEPTTEEPITEEPTTEEPTTEEPTTEEPTTEEPTTEKPTTEEPTTEEPATEEPATEEPTMEEPTTEEPTTEEPTIEEPTTEEPTTEESTTEEPTMEEPTTEEPSTEDSVESGEFPTTDKSDGWIEIGNELEQVKAGEKLYVQMNGANIVPSDIVNIAAGKDVQISFDMGNGFIWKVNGKNINADSEQTDLNLGICGGSEIPKELIDELANGQDVKEIQLFHNGEFGFKLFLNVALGKEYAGRQAKLYYYNEDESDFEMVTSALINEEGVAELEYDHASSYVIVINENKDVDTGDSGAGVIWKTLMVLSVMMVATLVYTEKKKSKTR